MVSLLAFEFNTLDPEHALNGQVRMLSLLAAGSGMTL